MSHHHSHSHGGHHHIGNYNRIFIIAISLNLGFVIIEAIYGVLANSMALLADAGHNLSDVLGLLLAWGAFLLARKAPTDKRTYGFRKATVLASFGSALLLLFALGAISWEAFNRLLQPEPVAGMTVIVVAAIGVVINTFSALLLMKAQANDLNLRGAFLHMAADAAISLGVVAAGLVILLTGWLWIDPLLSFAIVLVILFATWGLFKESLRYLMDFVPSGIDSKAVGNFLLSQPQVVSLHDLHIWPISTTDTALTVHLVISSELIDNAFLNTLQNDLKQQFAINHATFQIETSDQTNHCLLTDFC